MDTVGVPAVCSVCSTIREWEGGRPSHWRTRLKGQRPTSFSGQYLPQPPGGAPGGQCNPLAVLKELWVPVEQLCKPQVVAPSPSASHLRTLFHEGQSRRQEEAALTRGSTPLLPCTDRQTVVNRGAGTQGRALAHAQGGTKCHHHFVLNDR